MNTNINLSTSYYLIAHPNLLTVYGIIAAVILQLTVPSPLCLLKNLYGTLFQIIEKVCIPTKDLVLFFTKRTLMLLNMHQDYFKQYAYTCRLAYCMYIYYQLCFTVLLICPFSIMKFLAIDTIACTFFNHVIQ